jgi:hypothetical protein
MKKYLATLTADERDHRLQVGEEGVGDLRGLEPAGPLEGILAGARPGLTHGRPPQRQPLQLPECPVRVGRGPGRGPPAPADSGDDPMTPTSNKLSDAVVAPADGAEAAAPEYRTPARFPVGEAVDLVKQSSWGQLRDGSGGWYVWGS